MNISLLRRVHSGQTEFNVSFCTSSDLINHDSLLLNRSFSMLHLLRKDIATMNLNKCAKINLHWTEWFLVKKPLQSKTLMFWGKSLMFYKHRTLTMTKKDCRTLTFFFIKLSVQTSYTTFVMLLESKMWTSMKSSNRFSMLECLSTRLPEFIKCIASCFYQFCCV